MPTSQPTPSSKTQLEADFARLFAEPPTSHTLARDRVAFVPDPEWVGLATEYFDLLSLLELGSER
jgi:hypothetical protein